jgi:hypothetical protein
LFSPDHGLQKEAERRTAKLVIGGYGRLGIEEKLSPDRNNPRPLGELLEYWEGRK